MRARTGTAVVIDVFFGRILAEYHPEVVARRLARPRIRIQTFYSAGAVFVNSDAAVQWYIDQAVPPEKIVLGIPFYGQIWANVPDDNNGLYEPYKGRSGEEGTLSYREIDQAHLPVQLRHWDDQVKVPWLYKKETKIMISFEEPESIAVEAKYVIQKHLGGMMFWDLGQDDGKSTLLSAIREHLGPLDSPRTLISRFVAWCPHPLEHIPTLEAAERIDADGPR